MNGVPPSDDLADDIDERYRRASALQPSRPSSDVRRAVLENAAALAAAQRTAEQSGAATAPSRIEPTRPAARRTRWRPAIFGTLAAAALAGLLVTPRFLTQRPSLMPASAPSSASFADASRPNEGRARDSAQKTSAPQRQAPPAHDPAALRRAVEQGDIHDLQTLLAEHASIDARDADGRTALMLAVLHHRADAVDELLAHGAEPDAADSRGTTPLQAAIATNQPAVIAALTTALRTRTH